MEFRPLLRIIIASLTFFYTCIKNTCMSLTYEMDNLYKTIKLQKKLSWLNLYTPD